MKHLLSALMVSVMCHCVSLQHLEVSNCPQCADNDITTAIPPLSDGKSSAPSALPVSEDQTNIPCEGYSRIQIQPVQTANSLIRKCCPFGQHFVLDSQYGKLCKISNSTSRLKVYQINAVLYVDCIDDMDTPLDLNVIHADPCNRKSVAYGSYDDDEKMFVIQNGSLLFVTQNVFEIFDDYCLETESESGQTLAFVCDGSLTVAIFPFYSLSLFIPVPFLLAVAFIYLSDSERRTNGGKCLACLTISLAGSFQTIIIIELVQYFGGQLHPSIAYFAQIFFLSTYFWLFMIFLDTTLTICIYLFSEWITKSTQPHLTPLEAIKKYLPFTVYFAATFGTSIVVVAYLERPTKFGKLPYFLKYANESADATFKQVVPFIIFILAACLMMMPCWYVGIDSIQKSLRKLPENVRLSQDTAAKIKRFCVFKQMTIKLCLLYLLMSLSFIFELIALFDASSIVLFDLFSMPLGILIYVLFVYKIIKISTPKDILSQEKNLLLSLQEPNQTNDSALKQDINENNM